MKGTLSEGHNKSGGVGDRLMAHTMLWLVVMDEGGEITGEAHHVDLLYGGLMDTHTWKNIQTKQLIEPGVQMTFSNNFKH